MKITLFLSKRIIDFSLPLQVFGTYNFDENEEEDLKLINIEASDEEWYIRSTESTKVFVGDAYVDSAKIEKDTFYILQRGENRYLILASSGYDSTFSNYNFNTKVNLIVGNGSDCNVNYNCEFLNGVSFSVKYTDNQFVLDNSGSSLIYINKNALINCKQYFIKNGDLIQLYGLKIYLFSKFLLINNPKGLVFVNDLTCNLLEFSINQDKNLSDIEVKENELYTEKDYFAKSPRIRRVIETKEIKIDPPPPKQVEQEIPILYTLGPMLTMGITSAVTFSNALLKISNGNTTFAKSWTTLVSSGAMMLTTLLWPNLTKSFNRRQKKKREKERLKKYREYLSSKEKEIEQEAKLQKDILNENLITTEYCHNIIEKRNVNLWGRRLDQKDFLTARIGKGNIPLDANIDYPEDGFTLEEDVLKQEALKSGSKFATLENVPVGYSFLNNTITAIMGNEFKVSKFVDNILVQFMAFHSYDDLKIVVFTDESKSSEWEYLKYLQHTFDNNKQFRFFSTNKDEAKELSNYLEFVLNSRRYNADQEVERDYKNCKPYFLIITDVYSKIRRTKIMKDLTEINSNYGFSMIILENKLGKLPSKCSNFISIGEKNSGVLTNAYEDQKQINFVDEINYGINMKFLYQLLANIPIEFEHGNYKNLPNSITFLEMYNVGKVEQLNIINRWGGNDPTKSLKAEIGVDENGDYMVLDCHEKAHGPHGLIAGMTGSGKSEFIITFVLSMAVNYSPDVVSFVLIDYKGGGLAGAFENKTTGIRLPHLAGTITNLDEAEMNRTLVSIDSEITRRQKKFNEARDSLGESTIDIYKYQSFYLEGKLSDPIPHLFIICDEFAELKSQQPEFMDNLISVARIGRSLGVHLILATQKPSGVVNEQIWSNSKFRICLKVQDKGDSNEMLKRPDAAEIKQAGRFYLQVGYNEYFALGQSAWCGAKYYPCDKAQKQIDRSVNFINNLGLAVKSIQSSSTKKRGTAQGEELANILKEINKVAKKENLYSKNLWLENISATIFIEDLLKKYNISFDKNNIEAIIGEYDAPENQEQGLVKFSLNENGNTIIYGSGGNEYEMLVSSIIYSTTYNYSPDDINYYIIDYGSESLRKFFKTPHVGDMVFIGENQKQNNLFKMIGDEISNRKKMFTDFGGEYNTYIKNSNEKKPIISVIINNYDAFIESNSLMIDQLNQLCRDGQRYGVIFMFTTSNVNSITRRIKRNCNTQFALKLNDIEDYNMAFDTRVKVFPKEFEGRGLMVSNGVIHEFQTITIAPDDRLNDFIIEYNEKLVSKYKTFANPIPTLPDVVNYDLVSKYFNDINDVPIGIYNSTLQVAKFDFSAYSSTIISSNSISNINSFVISLITEFANIGNNIQVLVIDATKELVKIKDKIKYYYDNDFDKVIDMLINYLNQANNTAISTKTICFIYGVEKFKNKIDITKLVSLIKEIKRNDNFYLILGEDYKKIKKIEIDSWFSDIKNISDGIWIGTGVSEQSLFRISKITRDMSETYSNDFGYFIKENRGSLIKVICFDEREKESDINE